jgi:diguanylate cyclase (GGDEF)-like protein
VARTTRNNDDVTGKQLRLLIGLVVVLACGAVTWSVVAAVHADHRPGAWLLVGLILSIALTNRTVVWMRIRSTKLGISWTEVGVLVGLVLVPPSWLVICTVLAIVASKASVRMSRQKKVFSIAKETLVAATGGVVFALAHVPPSPNKPQFVAGTIAIAALAMWLADELLMAPIMVLDTHQDLRQHLRSHWDLRVTAFVARYVVTVLVVGILASAQDVRALLVVPPVLLCYHFWHTGRLRSREERRFWQRLAETTDSLNNVDLVSVLRSAVQGAAPLFSVEVVEIELRGPTDVRLVRGGLDGITYDGPPDDEPPATGRTIPAKLAGHDGSDPIGELRLRFRGPVPFTEAEKYKLKTFASALYTSIRNANTYAELERVSAEHAYAAAHDPLTGLANRRELLEHAERRFVGQVDEGMLALLLIDLNHFKEVNDTLGHVTGDKVLREVATRLRTASRPDDLVARLGGDEFAVLMTGLPTPAIATHRARTLLASLDRGIDVDGLQLTVEACGGIALAPGAGGVTELLRRADVAMYQAKRSGQRTATYVHSTDTADVGRLMLGGEVKRAMAAHEFVVEFQPIVDLGSGEVVSAEALARWHHPDHGDLTPMQFLETVERSGQLPAFADAVLRQSLAAAGSWQEAGFDLPVAVNVFPRSLLDPGFAASVLARLAEHDVAPDRLVLELVETLTISQLEVVERTLRELRDAGVQLALDDFGSGISPLSVLSQIPVHQLKIGREFVTAVETSSEAAAVIRSTVDLARSLYLTVVAEGVESEPQRHALWELGCVAGQGYLFARPMRAGRMLATLQRGSGGRPGVLAGALHDAGSVVRLPRRRAAGRGGSALPHLPA